ncbi:MAG: ion channel [Lutimonas sp.]
MLKKNSYPFLRFLVDNKILILLISLLLLVFSPPFIDESIQWMQHYWNFILICVVLSSFFIIREKKLFRFISYVTLLFILLHVFIQREFLVLLSQLGVSILILGAFIFVLKEAMGLKGESKDLLLASVTGYIIIGLIGGFLCAGLNLMVPNSFTHSTGIEFRLYHFIYFSFVSVTTLGYGDITPLTEKAQALSLLLALSGQLFLTIIMAINIAKFIQGSSRYNKD